MAEVTVTLIRDDSKFYVTVDLTIAKSGEPKMKSRLEEVTGRLKIPDGSKVSPIAAEAACFSGAFFALRKSGDYGYAVTIDKAFGEIPSGDLTICAGAVSIGVSYAVGDQDSAAEEVPDGWRLAERSKGGHL